MGDFSPSGFVQTGDLFYDSGQDGNYENSTLVLTSKPGTVIRVTFDTQ